MPDIFLSYNREDQARAKLFAEAFEREGFNVWWDVGLRTGEAYDEVTENALRTAKAVVVLWSKKSVQSRWVRAEATLADRNKTLVPCMIEPCERPVMFELVQTAELSHWRGEATDRVWSAYLADIRRFLGSTRADAPNSGAGPTLAQIIAEPPPTPEPLLAVLPFDNLSSDAEMQFFSDGVSEDILGRIQRGSALRVIGRTSSFQFRGADKAKAAAALNATHVLDGSIRRGGNKVRIAAHLTESATRTTLWSNMYDRALDDVFAVQDELSAAIAEALNARFFARETESVDPAVYDLYLRAQGDFNDPAKLAANIALLEAATRLAPTFALGWAALAWTRHRYSMFLPYPERPPLRARVVAELATGGALDADCYKILDTRYWMLEPFGAYLEQEVAMQAMLRHWPNSAECLSLRAVHLETVGRQREAVESARAARAIDPMSKFAQFELGFSSWRAGYFAEGRAVMEGVLRASPANNHAAALLILACAHQQDWIAVDELTTSARLARYPLREFAPVLKFVQALHDPATEFPRMYLDGLRARLEATGHADTMPFMFAAHLGFVDDAYEMLDRIKLGPSGGPGDVMGEVAYRTLNLFGAAYPELRADPRFVKLCARLGLVEYWLATQNWPDCADDVPYDFRATCAAHRDYPKDRFFA